MRKHNLLITLVNYFNDEQTMEFVNNLIHQQSSKEFVIAICNNGSKDYQKLNDFAVQHSDIVKVVAPAQNEGYLGGANQALKYYLKDNSMPNFVILCNTDMQIPDKHFMEKLIAKHTTSSYSLIAPNILVSDTMIPQNPYYQSRISANKMRLLIFVTSNFLLYKGYHLFYELKRKLNSNPQNSSKQYAETMYAMHGSFMIFKKQYFELGSTFDFPSFLFCEEIFIAETARKLNLKIYFEQELKVLHFEHATTGLNKNPTLVKYLHNSLIIIKNLFFND